MKKCFLILTVLCGACLMSCKKDKNDIDDNRIVSIMDGSIIFKTHPKVKITPKNEWVESNFTGTFPALQESGIFKSSLKMGAKASLEYDENSELRADHYYFKLVAEMETMTIDGVEVQATHVKLSNDGYAFVTYNEQYEGVRGGIVVYKYTVKEGTIEDATVDVKVVQSMEMPKAELSAVDYYNGKLYVTGASIEPKFGFKGDDGNRAFFMVVPLNSDKTFKEEEPEKIVHLTSFQGTSIRALNNRIYVTCGDGKGEFPGGLYVYNANTYEKITFIEAECARSVDVDAQNVYLMQAEDARVNKYDLDGKFVKELHNVQGEATQKWAKSEILAWDKYLFVAENESGLRMLNKTGGVNDDIVFPADWDKELHVSNGVFMNSDPKKTLFDKVVNTDLLFVANGEKGIYWYEIMKNSQNKDVMVPSISNSVLGGNGYSSNFIASKGNVVFVANGLGGLKVLYMGATKDPNWDCSHAFSASTYLRSQGSGDTKVGDIEFQAEGENLCVYIKGIGNGTQLKDIGCLLATTWDEIVATGVVDPTSGAKPEDWKISPSIMKDFNAQYRTTLSTKPAAVKFTFPKEYLDKFKEIENLICIIYGSDGWAYGIPTSPSGGTGGGQVNNSMYFFLGAIEYCVPIKQK